MIITLKLLSVISAQPTWRLVPVVSYSLTPYLTPALLCPAAQPLLPLLPLLFTVD